MSRPILEVDGLTTRFATRRGDVHAVNGVSFTVGDGEIVGIVGESGCGKSVTIRSILGLVRSPGRVADGRVSFIGNEIQHLPQRHLRRLRGASMGFIAQNPFGALNPILRIDRQFHNMIRAHAKTTRAKSRARAKAMMDAVGISDPERVLGGYAHELSGGMAQRVVIAMALTLDPRLVVADEPTTALDVTIQRQILDLLRRVVRDDHRSMLLVTHDLGVVAQYCDRVVVMYAGKVVESGLVADVFQEPAHPYTLALLQAVPRPGHELRALGGRVPDLVDYPVGCPYADRCRFRFDRCTDEAPELLPEPRASGADRTVSCHLSPEEVREDATHRG